MEALVEEIRSLVTEKSIWWREWNESLRILLKFWTTRPLILCWKKQVVWKLRCNNEINQCWEHNWYSPDSLCFYTRVITNNFWVEKTCIYSELPIETIMDVFKPVVTKNITEHINKNNIPRISGAFGLKGFWCWDQKERFISCEGKNTH